VFTTRKEKADTFVCAVSLYVAGTPKASRASDLPNLKGLKDSEYLGPLHNQLKQIVEEIYSHSYSVF